MNRYRITALKPQLNGCVQLAARGIQLCDGYLCYFASFGPRVTFLNALSALTSDSSASALRAASMKRLDCAGSSEVRCGFFCIILQSITLWQPALMKSRDRVQYPWVLYDNIRASLFWRDLAVENEFGYWVFYNKLRVCTRCPRMTQFLHGNYSRWPAHCSVGVVEPVWNEPEFSIVFDYVHKVIRVNAVRIHDKNIGFANFHCCLGSKLRSHRSTNIAQVSGLGLEAINCLISEALAFLCRWSDGIWHNVDTGNRVEATVVGWRAR